MNFIQTVFAQSSCTLNGQPVPCEVLNAGLAMGSRVAVFGFLGLLVIAMIWAAFVAKSKHSREIDKVLDAGEQILWEGKPVFWPFFISSLGGSFFGWFFLIFTWPTAGSFPFGLLAVGIPFFFAVVIPFYTLLVYKFTYYAITHKRVIMQSGVIGRDFKILDFDNITNAEVHVGILDKLFGRGSGTVYISSAGAPIFHSRRGGALHHSYALIRIPNPYDIFKILKEVGHAVKTDIQYPNVMRPKYNPGYQTEYKSEAEESHHPHNQPPQ